MLSLHEVPEFRFSEDWVSCEDSDSVEDWLGYLLAGDGSADDEVLSDLKEREVSQNREHTRFVMESTPTPLTISFKLMK